MVIKWVTKDLILTAFAALTSALIAFVLALIDTKVHFAIYGFSVRFIPIGAFLCGLAAASGFLLGFRVFPHRLTWVLTANAIVLSVATYFFVSYLDYSMLDVRGVPISQLLPFGKYLTMSIQNRQLYLNFMSYSPGPLNYVLVTVQLAGFVFGGLAMVRPLYLVPCCDRCDKKMKKTTLAQRLSNSLLGLEDLFQKMRSELAEGRSSDALQLVNAPNAAPRDAVHKLTLTLWRCQLCPVEFYHMFIKPGGEHVGQVRDYSPSRKLGLQGRPSSQNAGWF